MNLIIVGSEGVGKTTFVKRFITGDFQRKHIRTLGIELSQIKFENRDVIFNTWDCAGSDRFRGLGEDYHTQAKRAIVMFDVMDRDSCIEDQKYITKVRKVTGNIPVEFCANKIDISSKWKVKVRALKKLEEHLIQKHGCVKLFLTCSKSMYGVFEVLEWLADQK